MYLRGLNSLADDGGAFDMSGALTSPDSSTTIYGTNADGSISLPVPVTPGGAFDMYGTNSPPVASSEAPTANTDWTKLIGTAITAWGNFAVASKQADAAVKTAPYRVYAPYGYSATGVPLSSAGVPVQSVTAPISGTMIILGAVAIAAFLLMKG